MLLNSDPEKKKLLPSKINPNESVYTDMRPNFFRVAQISKNNIGYVFSFKIVFMWVLSRHCLLGKLATISYKTGTQNQKFLNQKTWPMLFFDVSETPKKI